MKSLKLLKMFISGIVLISSISVVLLLGIKYFDDDKWQSAVKRYTTDIYIFDTFIYNTYNDLTPQNIIYLIFYFFGTLIPLFMLPTKKSKIAWIIACCVLLPFLNFLTSWSLSYGLKSGVNLTTMNYIDFYNTFVKGTHKEWGWFELNFVDMIRIVIRFIILLVTLGGGAYFIYNQKLIPNSNIYAKVFSVIIYVGFLYPIIMSKLVSHDCIISGMSGELTHVENELELFNDSLKKHGGLLMIIIVTVISMLIYKLK